MPENGSLKFGNPRYNRSMYNTATGENTPVSAFNDPQSTVNYDELRYSSMSTPLGSVGRSKYDDQLSRQNIEYTQQFRAEDQGRISQLGNALNQALVGEIVGGTLEGLGYLGDIAGTINTLQGTEEEWGNWLSDVGKSLRTWTQEETPIYRTPGTEGKFQPWSWSYWMSNAPSIASTLSLFVPAVGTERAIAGLGRSIGMFDEAKMIASLVQKGITAERATNEVKAFTLGVSGINQAVMSRHMENMMEASQAYQSTLDDVYNTTGNLEQAKEIASKAAASDYTANWVMLAQDIPQYLLLGKIRSPKATLESTVDMAKALKQPLLPILTKKSYNVGWDLLSEGGEEAYQYIVGEESRRLAKNLLDPENNKDNSVRIGQYLNDGDFWTSTLMGALGAGAMHALNHMTRKIGKSAKGPDQERLNDIFSFGAQVSEANKSYQFADRLQDQAGKDISAIKFTATMGAKSAALGNIGAAKTFVDNLSEGSKKYTDQQLSEQFGMAPDSKNELIKYHKEINEGLQKIGDKFEFYTKPENGGFDSRIAANLAAAEYTQEAFADKVKGYKALSETKKLNIKGFEDLSLHGRELLETEADIDASTKLISLLENELKQDGISPSHKEEVQKQLTYEKDVKLPILKDNLSAQNKIYSKEDKDADTEVRKAFVSTNDKGETILNSDYTDYVKSRNSLAYSELELDAQKKYIDYLRKLGAQPKAKPANPAVDSDDEISETGEPLERIPGYEEGEEDLLNNILGGEQGETLEGELTLSDDPTLEELIAYEEEQEKLKEAAKNVKNLKETKKEELLNATTSEDIKDNPDNNITDETVIKFEIVDGKILIESREFSFPNNLPLNALKVEGQINLINKDGIPVTFSKGILVDEAAFVIRALEQARQEKFKGLQILPDKPVVVSYKNSDFNVYLTGEEWVVTPIKKKTSVSPLTKQGVLKILFDQLDKQINNEPTSDTDVIREQSPAEANESPDVEEISISKGDTVKSTPESDGSKEAASEIINETAERLASETEFIPEQPTLPEYTEDDTLDFEGLGQDMTPLKEVAPTMPSEEENRFGITALYDFTNQELQRFLLDPESTKEFDHVELSVDFDSTEYIKNWWNEHKGLKINKISDLITDIKRIDNLLDEIPIKAVIVLKDGIRYNTNLHTTKYSKTPTKKGSRPVVHIPYSISTIDNIIERTTEEKKIYDRYSDEVRNIRSTVIQAYIDGNQVTAEGIVKDGGSFNKGQYRNIPDILAIPADEIELAVSYKNGVAEDLDGNVIAVGLGDSLTGRILVKIGIKPNGAHAYSETQFQKLSTEHAEILFNALYTGLTHVGGFKAPVADDRVRGRNSHRTIELLVKWFPEAGPNNKITNDEIIDNAYLGTQGSTLYYGNNSIDVSTIKPDSEEYKTLKSDFVKHITRYKNYRVQIKNLNSKATNNFKIGSIEVAKGQTMKSVVLNNGFIKANMFKDPITKSFFRTPMVHFNSQTVEVKGQKKIVEQVKPTTIKPTSTQTKQSDREALEKILKRNLPKHRLVDPKTNILERRYEQADLLAEIGWLKERFPGVPVNVVSSLIRIAENGRMAWGAVRDVSVILYESIEKGTTYHEAFHVASMYYLTEKQRQNVYNEARRVYNKPSSTDEEIDDILAEEFRNYVLTEKKKLPLGQQIKQWFSDLYDWLYTFFTGDARLMEGDIEQLFASIDKGKFKRAKIRKSNLEKYHGRLYARQVGKFTHDQTRNIIKNIMYKGMVLNNIVSTQDVYKFDYKPVLEFYTNQLQALRELNVTDPEVIQLKDHHIGVLGEIVDNFKEFVEATDDFMLSLNIRTRKMTSDNGESEVEEMDYDSPTGEQTIKWDKSSHQHDTLDNVLANIKMFIATLPTGEVDPFTGMEERMDFRQAWAKIRSSVQDEISVYDMMDKLKRKADTDIMYKVLLYGVKDEETGELIRPGLYSEGFERLRTQFGVALNRFRLNYMSLLEKGSDRNKKYTIVSTSLKRDVYNTLRGWGENFLNSKFISKPAYVLSREAYKNLLKEYNSLSSKVDSGYLNGGSVFTNQDLESHILSIISITKQLGIEVDRDTVLYAAKSTDSTLDTGIYNLIRGSNGLSKVISFLEKNLDTSDRDFYLKKFRGLTFIRNLAEAFISTSPESISSVVLGAGNNMYYIDSLNSYLTDSVKSLRKNTKGIVRLLNIPIFNTNSVFIPQFEEKKRKFNIATFSSYSNTAYRDLDIVEDFLTRFQFSAKGYIPFPTLADKGTYHFYEGLDKLDTSGIYYDENNRMVIPDDVLKVFEGYVENERLRIEAAKNDINWAEENNNYDKLIKNYHFKTTDSNGTPILRDKEGKYTGNSTKYIHFPSFNTQPYSKEFLTKIIKNRIADTIEYAVRLGIIQERQQEVPNQNRKVRVYDNVLIDNDTVKKARETFKTKTDNNAIKYLLADFTLNGIVSTIETEMILSGDIAYYKDENDKIKRMSSIIAPGESPRIEYKTGEYAGRTSYSVSTIKTYTHKDTELPSMLSEIFTESLMLRDDKLSKTQAKDLADSLLSVYKKTDPSDAQVFITPKFYREVVDRLGEWSPEMEEAYKVLMSEDVLTREQEFKLFDVVMQPLKLVYYGMHFTRGLGIPVYDKMSLATLFPRQVKNTALEPLLNRMLDETKPIDVIKFDSAVKAGDRRPIVYFKDDDTPNLESLNDIVITKQHFNNLKRQQVTDPKDAKYIKLGTQVKKIIPSLTKEFGPLFSALSNKGRDILLNKLTTDGKTVNLEKFSKILRESFKLANGSEDFIDNFVVEDGKLKIQLDTFPERNRIQSRLISLIGKHTVDTKVRGDAYTQQTSIGYNKTKVGTSSRLKLLDDQNRTEISVSINMFKDIIPYYTKKTFEEAREWLHNNKEVLEGIVYRIPSQGPNMIVPFVIKSGKKAEDLGVLPSYTGNTVLVPYEFTTLTGSDFDIDKLYFMISNYEKKGNKLIKTEYFEPDEDGNITDERKLKAIYNQTYGRRLNKLSKLLAVKEEIEKDKGFVDKLGETFKQFATLEDDIREELEYTTEVLEDFGIKDVKASHIDEVIETLQSLPTEEKWINDNKGKSALDLNSTEAIQNKILDLYKRELTKKENMIDNRIPLDYVTDELKKLSAKIRELNGEDKRYADLQVASTVHQLQTKNIYISSKLGVGPFVLAQMHAAMSTGLRKLELDRYIGIGNTNEAGNTVLYESIGQDRVSVATWLSGLVSANVDAAKDPYIFYLNINRDTWGVVSLLLRAGAGINTFYFISQPSITDLCRKTSTSRDRDTRLRDTKIEYSDKLRQALKKEKKSLNDVPKFTDKDVFDIQLLEKQYGVSEDKRDSKWYAFQLAVLSKFSGTTKKPQLKQLAWDLSGSIQACGVDTKNYGNSFTSMRLHKEKIAKAFSNPRLKGTKDIMEQTFLNTYEKNSVDLGLELFGQMTFDSSHMVNQLFSSLVKENSFDYKSASQKESLTSDFNDGIYASIIADFYTSKRGMDVNVSTVRGLFEGPTALGQQIRALKTSSHPLKTNYLIQNLEPYINTKEKKWFLRLPLVDRKDTEFADRVKDAWKDLLNSPDPRIQTLGQRLILYAFYTSGGTRERYSIYNYKPVVETSLKVFSPLSNGISFDGYIKGILPFLNSNELSVDYFWRMRKEFYLNNWDKPGLMHYVEPRDMLLLSTAPADSKELALINNKLRYEPIFYVTDWSLAIGKTPDGKTMYKPYIMYSTVGLDSVYRDFLAEYVGNIQVEEATYPVYRTIEKKGYKDPDSAHVVKEYGLDRSAFEENHLPYIVSESEIENKLQRVIGNDLSFTYVDPNNRILDDLKNFEEVDEETVVEPDIDEGQQQAYEDFNKRTFEEQAINIEEPVIKGTIQTNLIGDLVMQGKAKTTIRSDSYHNEFYNEDGVYKTSKGDLINVTYIGVADKIGDKIRVVNLGKTVREYTLDEFGEAEGFDDWKGFLQNSKYSESFIKEEDSRHLYDISPYNKDIKLQERQGFAEQYTEALKNRYYRNFIMLDNTEYFKEGNHYTKNGKSISQEEYDIAYKDFKDEQGTALSQETYRSLYEAYQKGIIGKGSFINAIGSTFDITNTESIERLNTKIARFTKFIPGVINKDYYIKFDESLTSRGEWDPRNNTITFNPVLVATTTTGHEVFHILFDILYNSNPKLLNQGLEQIKSSEKINSIVNKKYSHITDTNTKNSEYLAYAVGNETERLFADYEKHSRFTRWLMRMYFYIKSKFGITKDAVRRMAEIIVYSPTSIKGKIPSIKDSAYKGASVEERITEKNDIYQRLSDLDKEDRTELGKLKTKVIQVLERRAKIYTRTGRIQAAVNELEILKDTILNASDNKHVLLSIARFIKQADKDITESHNKYLDLIRKENRGEKVFTARVLDRIRQNVEGYRILDDIANQLADLEYPNNREGYKNRGNIMAGKNYITKDLEYINAIIGKRNQLSSLYLSKGLKTLSDFLSPYHTHMYIQFKDRVETDYNKLKSKEETTQTLDEYTQDRLKAEEGNLKELTTLNIERELLKASKDINGLQRWLETVFDSNDAIVSAMVKAFETADFKAQDKTQKVFRQLVTATKDLEDYFQSSKLSPTNSLEFYNFMIERDSNGNPTGYITKEVKSTFWDARKKVINDARDKAVKEGKSVEKVQKAIDRALTTFNKKNAPYKAADYNKMQKAMLVYIDTLYKEGVTRNGVTLKMTKPEYDFYLEELGKRVSDLNFEATVPFNKYRDYGIREEIIAELDEWRRRNAFKYRTLKPQWINKEYKTLMDLDINDPRRKFYELIISISEDVEEGLPFIHRLRGRLPGIEKTGSERLSEGQGITKTLIERAKEAINVRPDETERGDSSSRLELVNEDKEPIHYLPVYFTSSINPKDQSYDLATIYYNYFRMGIDFKEKFEILPELEMARYFVNNRDYIKRDSSGNLIIDAISSAKEPVTEKGRSTNLAQQLNDWFEASVYGIRRKGEGSFTIPILGLTVDVAKAIDLMNRYTSISMLGLNFVGGTANFLLGEAQDVIEAAGKEFYSPKSFSKANAFYAKNLPLILGDIASRVQTNIVNVINVRFDVLNEYENGNIRENSKFKRLMHSNTLFFNMHAGEHAIQSTVALSMLEEMRAKDSKGNDIGSMLSNLKAVDGELVVDPKVANFTIDDQAKYKMQLKRVLSGMHGEYYRNAAEAWQRLSMFRTAMLFRKFLVPGFKRRWGKLGINELKGTYTEGYYRTFGRYISELVTSTRALGLSGAGESWDQLHSWEKANIRRMLTELVFLASAIVLARVFTKLSDDDDDDDGFTNFLAYQALRMRSELAFYLSPPAAMQILRSPAASVTMAESLIKFFGDLTYPVMSGTMEFDRYEQGNRKGQLKLTKSMTDLTPLYKQYYRFKYIDDQLSWFK